MPNAADTILGAGEDDRYTYLDRALQISNQSLFATILFGYSAEDYRTKPTKTKFLLIWYKFLYDLWWDMCELPRQRQEYAELPSVYRELLEVDEKILKQHNADSALLELAAPAGPRPSPAREFDLSVQVPTDEMDMLSEWADQAEIWISRAQRMDFLTRIRTSSTRELPAALLDDCVEAIKGRNMGLDDSYKVVRPVTVQSQSWYDWARTYVAENLKSQFRENGFDLGTVGLKRFTA